MTHPIAKGVDMIFFTKLQEDPCPPDGVDTVRHGEDGPRCPSALLFILGSGHLPLVRAEWPSSVSATGLPPLLL